MRGLLFSLKALSDRGYDMKYSISEVVEFIAENDVKFVLLVFCEVFVRIKNFTLMEDCIE